MFNPNLCSALYLSLLATCHAFTPLTSKTSRLSGIYTCTSRKVIDAKVHNGSDDAAASLNCLEFEYTHTEVNGMIWKIPSHGISLVIDPIVSQLDFGIPWGYRANHKVLTNPDDILDKIVKAQPTHCLLSQGLDDHTHLPTLKRLQTLLPDLQYVIAPSVQEKLETILPKNRMTVLKHGESMQLVCTGTGTTTTTTTETEAQQEQEQQQKCKLSAIRGALVGPPWQTRENGWLLELSSTSSTYQMKTRTILYEPHADMLDRDLNNLEADVVIAPVTKQTILNAFPLVYDRALTIAQKVSAKVLIPLRNGELDTEGPFAQLVQAKGSMDEISQVLSKASSSIRLERPTPGEKLTVKIP